jgi:hypothetical protein
MRMILHTVFTAGFLLHCTATTSSAQTGPFDGKSFKGRIAWSADGNFNDPDDWIASPVALAIFAQCGLQDRLVHFDNNCILPRTDPEWEQINTESVMGAAERYGYDRAVFHDCQQDKGAAIASIARAINASTADEPLYFVMAGPMEVPCLGIRASDAERRRFVYCISHSRWNDGFSSQVRHDYFTFNKRGVIESGVNWVQIQDQNRLLSKSRYGQPARPEEFAPYFWMRDSRDARVRFLWDRMQVSTRPDPSDAGMAYFLVSGDEEADPDKFQRLINEGIIAPPVAERTTVRLEAENFRDFDGYELEDRNDRTASHRLNVKPAAGGRAGRIRTRFNEPYTAALGRYDVSVRYFDTDQKCALSLSLNGAVQGAEWNTATTGAGWTTHTIPDVAIAVGDEIVVHAQGVPVALDYVQLDQVASPVE